MFKYTENYVNNLLSLRKIYNYIIKSPKKDSKLTHKLSVTNNSINIYLRSNVYLSIS